VLVYLDDLPLVLNLVNDGNSRYLLVNHVPNARSHLSHNGPIGSF
jgi:hypothetical protein